MWKFFNIFKLENPLPMKSITILFLSLLINITLFGQQKNTSSATEFVIQLNKGVDIDKFLAQFNRSKKGITFEKKRAIIPRENLHLITTNSTQANSIDLLKQNALVKKAFLNYSA